MNLWIVEPQSPIFLEFFFFVAFHFLPFPDLITESAPAF